jgi:hypothetical protein
MMRVCSSGPAVLTGKTRARPRLAVMFAREHTGAPGVQIVIIDAVTESSGTPPCTVADMIAIAT